tara:strand:- start:1062 stop:1253 length:192 start_codon:yes stop_codon:yes gene_type:complete
MKNNQKIILIGCTVGTLIGGGIFSGLENLVGFEFFGVYSEYASRLLNLALPAGFAAAIAVRLS